MSMFAADQMFGVIDSLQMAFGILQTHGELFVLLRAGVDALQFVHGTKQDKIG